MIRIREVKTKKEQRAFVQFPNRLYKGNPYYVPMLYSGEFDIFKPDYPFNKVCDSVCYLALKDGKVVGRIQGIIQTEANEKWGQKRVRFTRFDSIDDVNVAAALFQTVEKWAKERGMEEFVGPLGYSDLEREGLLIEGFEEPQTYEEQYNYPYYQCPGGNFFYDEINQTAIYSIDVEKGFAMKTVTVNYAKGDHDCLCLSGLKGKAAEEACNIKK